MRMEQIILRALVSHAGQRLRRVRLLRRAGLLRREVCLSLLLLRVLSARRPRRVLRGRFFARAPPRRRASKLSSISGCPGKASTSSK